MDTCVITLCSRRFFPPVALLVASLFPISACGPSVAEPVDDCDPTEAVIPRIDDDPFYWYDNEKVPLSPDSTVITLSALGDDPEAVMQSLLEEAGLVVESFKGLPGLSDWRRAHLRPETSLAAARSAVEALREEDSITFVSLAYRHDIFRYFLVNRMVVKFTDEATSKEIDCLNASVGMTVERLPSSPGRPYWLTFPQGAEPLSISNFYHLHPLTEWADTDSTHEVLPQGK